MLQHGTYWKQTWKQLRSVFHQRTDCVISLRVNSKKQKSANVSPALSAAKRRWFLTFTLAFPFHLIVFLELILRTAHYGPDLLLFTTEAVGDRVFHIMNPPVKARYFSRVEFSHNTSPEYFAVSELPIEYEAD